MQRIIPDAILCSSKFITAKTSVKPAYENTTIGRYLLTFSVISIISTINFMRSALVSSTPNHWSKNDIKVINLSTNSWFEGPPTILYRSGDTGLFIIGLSEKRTRQAVATDLFFLWQVDEKVQF